MLNFGNNKKFYLKAHSIKWHFQILVFVSKPVFEAHKKTKTSKVRTHITHSARKNLRQPFSSHTVENITLPFKIINKTSSNKVFGAKMNTFAPVTKSYIKN